VPQAVKRTLTSLQITQFLVGSSYAIIHSFVSYAAPVVLAKTASSSPEIINALQPCITNSGATFAVWLNVFYLAPLTVLFVNFFMKSYVRRSPATKPAPKQLADHVSKAGIEAVQQVSRA